MHTDATWIRDVSDHKYQTMEAPCEYFACYGDEESLDFIVTSFEMCRLNFPKSHGNIKQVFFWLIYWL